MAVIDQIKEAIRSNDVSRLKDVINILNESLKKLTDLRDKTLTAIERMRPQSEDIIANIFGAEPALNQPPIMNRTPMGPSLSLFSGTEDLPMFPMAKSKTPDFCQAFIAYTMTGTTFTLKGAYEQVRKYFNFNDEHLKAIHGGSTQVWQQRVSKMINREMEKGLLVSTKRGVYCLNTGITLEELKLKHQNWAEFFKNPTKKNYPYQRA